MPGRSRGLVLCLAAVLPGGLGVVASDFVRPSTEEILDAIGDVSGMEGGLAAAFLTVQDFAPIPLPGPGDWLLTQEERG